MKAFCVWRRSSGPWKGSVRHIDRGAGITGNVVDVSVPSAELIQLLVGYLTLAMAARLTWIALRGWHVIADRDAALLDVVAVAMPFGLAAAAEPLVSDVAARGLAVALAIAAVSASLVVLLRSAIGLRWQALGDDAAGLERMGIATRPNVLILGLLAAVLTVLAAIVAAPLMVEDRLGHLALAGLIVIMLDARPAALLLWVAMTVVVGAVWSAAADDRLASIIVPLAAGGAAIVVRRRTTLMPNRFSN